MREPVVESRHAGEVLDDLGGGDNRYRGRRQREDGCLARYVRSEWRRTAFEKTRRLAERYAEQLDERYRVSPLHPAESREHLAIDRLVGGGPVYGWIAAAPVACGWLDSLPTS